jgi:hypothetical protein
MLGNEGEEVKVKDLHLVKAIRRILAEQLEKRINH